MERWLQIVFCIVIVSVSDVLGCSPIFPIHMQNLYCNSDRVIVGEVLSVKAIGDLKTDPFFNFGKWRYTVIVWSVLKGYGQKVVGKKRYVFTPGNDGLCKLGLKVGVSYLLGGKKQGKNMSVLSVGLNSEYFRLTIDQLFFLYTKFGDYSYGDNCDCKVTQTDNANSCAVDFSNSSCFATKDICRRKNGTCSWLRNDC